MNLLTTRRSSKKLATPVPNAKQLEQTLQAATQVPDHGNMHPYHFTIIQSGTGLQCFHEPLSKTATKLNFGDDATKKAEHVGNMAPMIIGVTFTPNREVVKPRPEWEQILTVGCAAYVLQLAAPAQDFDNVWITGMWVNSPLLRETFECTDKNEVIGLIMIGSPTEESGSPKNTDLERFTTYW